MQVFGPISAQVWALGIVFGLLYLALGRLVFGLLLRFLSRGYFVPKLIITSVGMLAAFLLLDEYSGSESGSVAVFFLSLIIMAPTSLVLLCLVMIFAALAVAYVGSGGLIVGEFVVRRIAEYPKGPILALSAFFGCVAALFKAFV